MIGCGEWVLAAACPFSGCSEWGAYSASLAADAGSGARGLSGCSPWALPGSTAVLRLGSSEIVESSQMRAEPIFCFGRQILTPGEALRLRVLKYSF